MKHSNCQSPFSIWPQPIMKINVSPPLRGILEKSSLVSLTVSKSTKNSNGASRCHCDPAASTTLGLIAVRSATGRGLGG